MTTINQAILETLKTDAGKEPKHMEMLEGLGYELSGIDKGYTTWTVNGYGVRRYGKWEACLGGRYYEGLDTLRKIDWADFLAKRGERVAKRNDMNKHNGIWEDRRYTVTLGWGGPKTYMAGNETVERFKRLRKLQDTGFDERGAERARKELERAKKAYDDAMDGLSAAKARAEKATAEIAAMLGK